MKRLLVLALPAICAFGQVVKIEPLEEVELQPRVGIERETTLTLQQAIERVLASDRNLEISRIERDEAVYNVSGAKGAYDPVIGLKTYRTKQVIPVSSILGGSATGKLSQTELNATPQLSGLFPWGGSYSGSFVNSRQQSDNLFNSLNPQYVTSVNLGLNQPLWGGLRFDQNRYRLQVARKNQQITSEQLRQQVIQTVTQAVQAYWELNFAWHNLEVQTEAVRLAERQYASNRRLAEQGILAPVDVVAAQTQVAMFQESLFTAQQALTQAENNLKVLMLPNRDDIIWSTGLVPVTELMSNVELPNLADAVKQALRARPELSEAALSLEVNQLDSRLSRETAKPHVDAFANLSVAGLAGRPGLSGSNPLADFFPPGTALIPPLLIGGYGNSLNNLATGNFPTAQVGLQISLPLRNRAAEAQEAIATAEGHRLRAMQEQVGMAVEADVRNALQGVKSAQSRLDAASLARRSAETQYESEQRQFQAGTSTVFLVLQRQTDFITARSREVRARADLGEMMANLDRAMARTIEANNLRLKNP